MSMKTPVSTVTCPNPKCAKPHALFWYVTSNSRQLTYRCDKIERQGKHPVTGAIILKIGSGMLAAPAGVKAADGLPTVLSRPAQEKAQGRRQFQLPMMKL